MATALVSEVNFLPSEIARLVLGYLSDVGCNRSHEVFLSECPHLTEYASLIAQGRCYPTTVMGKSLQDILAEYCMLRSFNEERNKATSPGGVDSVFRLFETTVMQLKQLCPSTTPMPMPPSVNAQQRYPTPVNFSAGPLSEAAESHENLTQRSFQVSEEMHPQHQHRKPQAPHRLGASVQPSQQQSQHQFAIRPPLEDPLLQLAGLSSAIEPQVYELAQKLADNINMVVSTTNQLQPATSTSATPITNLQPQSNFNAGPSLTSEVNQNADRIINGFMKTLFGEENSNFTLGDQSIGDLDGETLNTPGPAFEEQPMASPKEVVGTGTIITASATEADSKQEQQNGPVTRSRGIVERAAVAPAPVLPSSAKLPEGRVSQNSKAQKEPTIVQIPVPPPASSDGPPAAKKAKAKPKGRPRRSALSCEIPKISAPMPPAALLDSTGRRAAIYPSCIRPSPKSYAGNRPSTHSLTPAKPAQALFLVQLPSGEYQLCQALPAPEPSPAGNVDMTMPTSVVAPASVSSNPLAASSPLLPSIEQHTQQLVSADEPPKRAATVDPPAPSEQPNTDDNDNHRPDSQLSFASCSLFDFFKSPTKQGEGAGNLIPPGSDSKSVRTPPDFRTAMPPPPRLADNDAAQAVRQRLVFSSCNDAPSKGNDLQKQQKPSNKVLTGISATQPVQSAVGSKRRIQTESVPTQ